MAEISGHFRPRFGHFRPFPAISGQFRPRLAAYGHAGQFDTHLSCTRNCDGSKNSLSFSCILLQKLLVVHRSSFALHLSSLISHPSSLIPHPSSLIAHR